MIEDFHVLFIEGYCQVSWMQNKYQTYKSLDGEPRFAHLHPFRVWCADPEYLNDEGLPPDAFGVERGQQEIESGRYHAVIVLDYSDPDEVQRFETDFGSLLQKFAAAGGVVAFASSEGLILSTLAKFFDVEWKMASYSRITWAPSLDVNESNILDSFGKGKHSREIIKEYSAKAVSMRSVPHHERCFGITDPYMDDDYDEDDEEDERAPAQPNDANYESVVAMHEYGKGVIAYFGDVNAEDHTIELVAAFVESRSPSKPVNYS
jgi:hypothetical protein